MKTTGSTPILDYGYIALQDWMGNDETIVKKARQSHDKEHLPVEPGDLNLINSLMKNKHGTPFEMVSFIFNVKCPIFVAREFMRHRVCSFNEMSARYVELKPEFYMPEVKNVRRQVDKKIKYKFEPVDLNVAHNVRSLFTVTYDAAWMAYQEMLQNGVAKEVARMVLPVGIYTKFSWCINLRSLFNFISLRSHETAMYEIRQYSQEIEKLIQFVVPVAYQAFLDNERAAP